MNELHGANTPKYLIIARSLQEEIATRYNLGDYLPSERTLQKIYQANSKTIRSALAVLAQEGLVETVPYRGTIVLSKSVGTAPLPLLSAGGNVAGDRSISTEARGGSGQTVALVTPMENYLVVLLARGVERELRRHGLRLQLCSTYTYAQIEQDIQAAQAHEREILESLPHDGVSGVIWWSAVPPENYQIAQQLQDRGMPIVQVDICVPSLGADWVGADDYGAALHAAQHLQRLGHDHIAFWAFEIGSYIPSPTKVRLAGFLAAMQQANAALFAGYPPLPSDLTGLSSVELMQILPPRVRELVYFYDERSVEVLLSRTPRATAVVATSDLVAYTLMEEMDQRGLRVPEDIAIVSFGDINRHAHPPSLLTSVRMPYEEMGRRAVSLLLQRLQQPDRPVQHVYLPTQLIVRKSCGALGAAPEPVRLSPEQAKRMSLV